MYFSENTILRFAKCSLKLILPMCLLDLIEENNISEYYSEKNIMPRHV